MAAHDGDTQIALISSVMTGRVNLSVFVWLCIDCLLDFMLCVRVKQINPTFDLSNGLKARVVPKGSSRNVLSN